MARVQTSGNGGNGPASVGNIDGGDVNGVYLVSQDLDCGAASTVSFQATLSGGDANSTYLLG